MCDPSRYECGLDREIGQVHLRDPSSSHVDNVDRGQAGSRAGSKPPGLLADSTPVAGYNQRASDGGNQHSDRLCQPEILLSSGHSLKGTPAEQRPNPREQEVAALEES
jgi:hypothetical protein